MNTILVVDDRPDTRYATTRVLAGAGFDVRETATGREALRLARLQIDAMVLDLVLLDMNGLEVLRQLKVDRATQDIPVIVKSGVLIEDGHRARAMEAGAAAYFEVPFDPQALIAAVRHVLGDGSSASPSPA